LRGLVRRHQATPPLALRPGDRQQFHRRSARADRLGASRRKRPPALRPQGRALHVRSRQPDLHEVDVRPRRTRRQPPQRRLHRPLGPRLVRLDGQRRRVRQRPLLRLRPRRDSSRRPLGHHHHQRPRGQRLGRPDLLHRHQQPDNHGRRPLARRRRRGAPVRRHQGPVPRRLPRRAHSGCRGPRLDRPLPRRQGRALLARREARRHGHHARPRHHQDAARRPRPEARLRHHRHQEHGRGGVQAIPRRRQPAELRLSRRRHRSGKGQARMRHAALLLAGALAPATALAAPAFAPVWTEHAVIQRDQPITVQGTAAPNATVEVKLGTQSQSARTDAQGRFSTQFAARPASDQPLTLTATDSTGTATVSDLLVGDVWLCSGQSNMEFPVSRGLNGDAVAMSSADDGLRLLMIPKATSPTPQATFAQPVRWTTATPETVAPFSAACYFMADKLRQELKVPIGAIHSNWGGSQIRAWLTPEGGRAIYGEEQMALLERVAEDPLGAVTTFAPTWETWGREASGGQEPWRNPEALEWQPVPAIAPWPTWAGTRLASDPIGNVWLRRTVTLTPEQAAAGGTLMLGVLDDLDATWVN